MIPTKYINAGPMAAQLNPAAAMAPGKALENLGHSIEQTGQVGMDLVARARKAEEGGARVAFLADAHEKAAEFANKLARRSDTGAWVADWKTEAADLHQRAKNLGLSPESTARLNSDLLDFTTHQGIKFESQALSKGLGIAKAQTEQTVSYHRARLEGEAHDRALAIAEESGIMNPAEVQRAKLIYKQEDDNRNLQERFKADPQSVIDTPDEEFLKIMPGATLEMIARAKSAAKSKVQEYRGAELDRLEADLDRGVLHPRSIEAASYLTPGDTAKLTKAMKKVDPPTAEAHGAVWDLLLANRNTFTDPAVSNHDYAARWNDLRTQVLASVPAEYRGDINQELNYRSPANRTEAKTRPRPSNDTQELKSIALERITRAREANLLGSVDKDADPVTREKAFRRGEELRLQTSRFINDTPDLTIEKVTEFTDRILSGDRVKTTAASLQSFVPGAAQRLRPRPADPRRPDLPTGDGSASPALLPPAQQLNDFLK